jgi:hypothetical protein
VKCFKPKQKVPSDAYDFLRLYYKDAGSQCAKIRAEFTMYNGLGMVFFASSVSYLMFTSIREWRVLIILLVTTLATGIRGRTTRDTFEQTVSKFANKTTFPRHPPTAYLARRRMAFGQRRVKLDPLSNIINTELGWIRVGEFVCGLSPFK